MTDFKPMKSGDLPRASALFFDAVADCEVRVRSDARLDDAVAGAGRRLSGDQWAWSRKAGTSDTSPLLAATVALWMSSSQRRPVDPMTQVW